MTQPFTTMELAGNALALLPAARSATAEEGCLDAEGAPSGGAASRPCSSSPQLRSRLARAVEVALESGYGGACLDQPDSALALGLMGSGFCERCLAVFSGELRREYGNHFGEVTYPSQIREAIAQASGAVTYSQLPFGADFLQSRVRRFEELVHGVVRVSRDRIRAKPRPFKLAARFSTLGPAQIRAARHLDASIFPTPAATRGTGAGTLRLLRATMGRRACAALLPEGMSSGQLARTAAVAAACGVEVIPPPATEEAALKAIEGVRRFTRQVALRRGAPDVASPVADCAILYSADCDLWTGGEHREAVERVGEMLASLHLQAPVVLRPADAPPGACLVLAGAAALTAQEAAEVQRRVENGGRALVMGNVGTADVHGRITAIPTLLGMPGGQPLGKGVVVGLPLEPGAAPLPTEPIAQVLTVLLSAGRMLAVVTQAPFFVAAYRGDSQLDLHLVGLGSGTAAAAPVTVLLGRELAGGARKARLLDPATGGEEEKLVLESASDWIYARLPRPLPYSVLSVPL